MGYNKKDFRKVNDKKVLHKIRKHWVVVSTALLMALGGGALATHVSANADAANNNDDSVNSANTLKGRINQQLQQPKTVAQPKVTSNQNNNGSISNQANTLHQRIVQNAVQNQSNNSNQSGSTPKVNSNPVKANTKNPLSNVTAPKVANVGDVNNGSVNSTDNKVDIDNSHNNVSEMTPNLGNVGATETPSVSNVGTADPSHYDSDNLYPKAIYQSDGNKDVWNTFSDYNSDTGSDDDFGRIIVRYVDKAANNTQVGTLNILGPTSDGVPFTDTTKKGLVQLIPSQANLSQYGFEPVNTSNLLDPSNFDSGQNINKYIGGENQYLTINVKPKPAPSAPGTVQVSYLNHDDGDHIIQSRNYTNDGSAPLDQAGFTNNPVQGYKTIGWSIGDSSNANRSFNPANSSDGTPDTPKATSILNTYGTGNHFLNVFVVPESNQVSATVHYINDSDGSEVGTPRTIYGSDVAPDNTINFADLTNYVPSGYQYDGSYDGGHSGDAIFKPGNLSSVKIYVKKGNPTPNSQPVNYGTVTIKYQMSDNSGHGTGPVINTYQAVGPTSGSGSAFNIDDYKNEFAAEGYTGNTTNDQDNGSGANVTQYKSTPQSVYIYLKKTGTTPAQVSNDYIQYESVDPDNPSNPPQVINNPTTNNYKEPLYGAPGTPINYGQYTSTPPQGYIYAGKLGTHSGVMESNQDNIILVERSAAPVPINQGTIYVHYLKYGSSKDVDTASYTGPVSGAGSSFSGDWTSAKGLLPSGYSIDPSHPANENGVTQFTNLSQDTYIYVTGNPTPSNVTNDYIQYMAKDPNDPSVPAKPISPADGGKVQLTGLSGTNIDYTQYINNDVPKGYTFMSDGSPMNTTMQNNQTNYIDVEKSRQMAAPLDIHYIDANTGSDVDRLSTRDAAHGNIPVDEKPLTGSFGQTFNLDQIQSARPLPTGYTIASGQDDLYAISNNAQNVDIMVKGTQQDPAKNSASYNFKINRRIVDPDNNLIMSDTPFNSDVTGNTGSIITVDPNQYMPNPHNYYAVSDASSANHGNPYKYEITGSGLVQGNNDGNTIGQPIGNSNTITITYKESTATGKVIYEDDGNGNNVVGTKKITGTPNITMSGPSGVYNTDQLLDFIPYGYKVDNSAAGSTNGISNSNNAKLENGANYVIYVKNAHMQPRPVPTPRKGYGYIQVNYQMNNGAGGLSTVNSTVATAPAGTTFDHNEYATPSYSGGYMPDIYNKVNSDTTSDEGVTSFNNGLQQYNIIVSKNNADPYTGKVVTDQINYVQLDQNGNIVNPNPMKTTHISGTDGDNINYAPYVNNVPEGYYYDGTAAYGTAYTDGLNTSTSPIAVIYLMKAKAGTHNVVPGYTPSDTPSDTPSGHTGYDGSAAKGDYFPWTDGSGHFGRGNSGDAPLDGPENGQDPISADGYNYNNANPRMPYNWDNDNHGYLPTGYLPAWVPNAKGSNQYGAGFIPSDNVPDGYIPGMVPNGDGGYVPGYIPSDPANQPSGSNNHGKTVPHYVPGNVPNGHGGTTPGYVPSQSTSITIQYVNASNPAEVIQNDSVNGQTGEVLDLSNPDSRYLTNLPSGYTLSGILGKMTDANSADDKTSGTTDVASPNKYTMSDQSYTVQIGLNQNVVGNIVYDDADNGGAKVGSDMIDGAEGSQLNFNNGGADYKYLELLPYNYKNPTVQGSSTPTLTNGGVYVINVHEAGNHPAPSPRAPKGRGYITINYRNAMHANQILGTETLNGSDNANIANRDKYTETTDDGGFIPYGYKNVVNAASVNSELADDTFSSTTPQTIDIDVQSDSSQNNAPTKTDKIAYDVVTKAGLKPLYTSTNGLTTNAGAPGAHLLTFDVTGKAGSVINYAPYRTNVPSGYYYDGMGNYDSVIDGSHNGTNDVYDTIYVRPAIARHNAHANGTITINYKDTSGDPTDPENGQTVDTISLNKRNGSIFDSGYYEANLPAMGNYQFNGMPSWSQSVTNYLYNGGTPQNVEIDVKPVTVHTSNYSNVRIHFVENNAAAAGGSANPTGLTGVPGQSVATIPGLIGNIFSPQAYEDNTPANTTYDHIANGGTIGSFSSAPQDVYIAVNSTDGAF